MKKICLLFFMIVAGCAAIQKAPTEQAMSMRKVIEVPGMTKEQIFNRTNEWVARYLQSVSADISSGIILAKGEVDYPSPSEDRAQYSIVFAMKNEIRDNKNEVTFDKIMLKSPNHYISEAYTVQEYTGGEETPIASGRDVEAAKNVLEHIVDNLTNYLKRTAEPLIKCSTCGVIFTSPAGITDHLKHHPEHEAKPADQH